MCNGKGTSFILKASSYHQQQSTYYLENYKGWRASYQTYPPCD